MYLDHDWFTLERASTLIANHDGLLHAALPIEQAPASVAADIVQSEQQKQPQGKQKAAKPVKREQSPLPLPSVPLSAVEAAANALSGMFAFVMYGLQTLYWPLMLMLMAETEWHILAPEYFS